MKDSSWKSSFASRARDVIWFLRQFRLRPRRLIHSTQRWLEQDRLTRTEDENRHRGWYRPIYQEETRIHPKVEQIRALPYPRMRDVFVQQIARAGVYYLPHTYIFSEWGAVISRRNEIFTEFMQFFQAKSFAKSRFGRAFGLVAWQVERTKNWVALLAAPGVPENYYHWVLNILPRVHLLRELRPVIELYGVPDPLTPAQEQSLLLLGLQKDQFLRLGPRRKVFCEHLLVPSLSGGDGNTPDWAIEFLRTAYRPTGPVPKHPGLRIYIPRGATLRRPVANEAEVKTLLGRRGYTIASLADLSFRQQVDLFQAAEIVVAPHGAGLVNMVFGHALHVLEIFSPSAIVPCYCSLALQCGHVYRHMVGLAMPPGKPGEIDTMAIALPELEQAVDELETLAAKTPRTSSPA